jgi:glycosyltransferase involved in cell wall biosynthesis
MKILMLHNRYRERGGEDYSSAAEVELLRSAGIDCTFHQVDNRDMQSTGIAAAVNAVWSRDRAREISGIVRDRQIDLVHVQNFFPQLSPAVHWAARQAGAAVVQTLRNYRLACVNGQFFRDGQICEDCLGRSPIRGIVHRCYRDSFAASSAVGAMLVAHRMIGTWTRKVDRFIAVSEFIRTKLVEAGLPPDRVEVKPNFLPVVPAEPGPGAGGYFVYVGRLSQEKGIRTLLEAWKTLRSPVPGLKLVGSGPMDEFVKSVAAQIPQVVVLGPRSAAEVLDIVGRAEALMFPSEWYEGHPRVMIEALSVGTPIIASNVGAITEVVQDGVSGLQFRAGSAVDIAAKVKEFVANRDRISSMRLAARKTFLARYTAGENIKMMLRIYERARAQAARGRDEGAHASARPTPL